MFSQNYYWYNGEKIFLEKVENKKFIVFNSFENPLALTNALNIQNLAVKKFDNLKVETGLRLTKPLKNTKSKWAVIEVSKSITLENNENILYHAPFFLTPEKIEAGLSNLFYVKLKKTEDFDVLQKQALKNNVEIIGNNNFMPLWYTLSCSKKSKGNSLQMANYFYEIGMFEASQPDLMTDDSPLCVNDTHFNNQWNLNNTGQNGGTNGIDINFCDARLITSGDPNIIVAVLDTGVEMNHPDLTNMHPLSFDTESGTSPSQVLGNHGTACAGIIGANSNNGDGVSGIAPDSPIMSISNSLAATPNSRQRRADGINFAVNNGASVISNSWGSAIQYQIIDDAIDNALTNGRNGLGCVVVFASGNDNGAVNYPANSNDDILVVGAMSQCGERKNPSSCDGESWWGGNFGTQLDIAAPGVLIPTTDRQGANGYNTNSGLAGDYTQNFNGTSSACPHVAGVAALVLSVNPNLTSQEVNNIIESTAQKVGGYNFSTTANRSNGTWNNEMGYGLINALAAVQAAQVVTISGQELVCSSSNSVFTLQNAPNNVNWSTSSNLEIISSTTSTITVKAKYANSRGDGFITANYNNGAQTTKQVYVGKPYANLPQAPIVCTNQFSMEPYALPASKGAESYRIVSSSPNLTIDGMSEMTYQDAPVLFNFLSTSAGNYLVELFTTNACGISRAAMYVTSERCGGPGGFSISPNPASTEVMIKSNTEKSNTTNQIQSLVFTQTNKLAKLFDFNGAFVKEVELNLTGTTKLDVSNLKEGMYFLKIQAREEEETYKIIVKH